jgi:hypothetical protein
MIRNQSALTFITESLPAFEVGEEYSEWLQVSGGTPPYSFKVIQGNLPPGIDVSPMGTVNGVPSVAGDTAFWVKVTDSSGATLTQAFDAQVSPQPNPNGGHQ